MNTSILGFKSKNKEEEEIDKENLLQYITPEDLKSFGLIPELIGRLPVLSHLNPLDKATLRKILTEPKNALIKQYQKLFTYEGIDFNFSDDALDFIVEKALDYKLGARGLRSICEAICTDAMYELPSEENVESFIIDKDYAMEKLNKSKLSKLEKVA